MPQLLDGQQEGADETVDSAGDHGAVIGLITRADVSAFPELRWWYVGTALDVLTTQT